MAADFLNNDINSLGIEDEDRRRLSGITLGKGDIMLRIYEKAGELERSKNKKEKLSITKNRNEPRYLMT